MADATQTASPSRVTVQIPGGREAPPKSYTSESTRQGQLKIEPLKSVAVESTRAGAEPIRIPDLPADTVVEVELNGGIRLWTNVGSLREDLGGAGARGAAPDELIIPAAINLGTPSRGWGEWVIKGLNFFNVYPEQFLAKKLCNFWEEKTLHPVADFYRLQGDAGSVKLVAPGTVPTDRPVLVFIHGTASTTEGSFSELWAKASDELSATAAVNGKAKTNVWTELKNIYGEHIYALQHRTLTVSPIQNALELAKALPEGARLHLVSHSRGGLVGELLCRGNAAAEAKPFDDDALNLFSEDNRGDERAQLKKLDRELREKHFRIERFVRVACPARGTSLASGRLDQFFSLLATVAGQTAPITVGPIVEFFTDLAIAVAKERTNPKVLPGLEAMIPDSPIVRMLNTLPVPVDSELTVISGDIEASGALGALATVITDVFLYDDDHDLVVDTRYMFGGAPRKTPPRFMFDHGGKVNHFSYFKNESTAVQLLRGLRGEQDGFKPYEIGEDELDERFYRHRGAGPAPVVFVLPGIMGCHLKVTSGNQTAERIWLDPLKITGGGLVDKLPIDTPNVEPEQLIAKHYKRLIEFLALSYDVRPFAYDWRKSLGEAGDGLALEVTQALDAVKGQQPLQPVRIIAHSTGGLIARAMIARHPDVWQRMCQHNGSRLVMLGTPTSGSLFALRLLSGQERLARDLALLDIRHTAKQIRAVMAAFPGLLETLPDKTAGLDLFDPAVWSDIAGLAAEDCPIPNTAALTRANFIRAQLAAAPLDPKHVVYVAGLAPTTPATLAIDRAASSLRVLATPRGDGRVTWDAGIPKGIEAWYIPAEHGDMADYQEGFEAFRELLESGTTTRLSRSPLTDARAVAEGTVLSRENISAFPDAAELASAAAGGSPRPRRRRAAPVAKVEAGVTHGDLAFVDDPVAVGHYVGDTIVSAESYLDGALDGRLRKRLALNLYPGPLDTVQVFLNRSGQKPGGAIVIGLGQVGDLTPGKLSHVFTRAILEYALAQEDLTPDANSLELKLASVLIGTSAGGFPVEQSVTSMLRGVVDANRMLALRKSRARLVQLEFIELYEDLAILAARALNTAANDPELAPLLQTRRHLCTLTGGRYRAVHEDQPGWWNRLIINETETGELKFSAPTDRARTEVALVATQKAAADRFLSEATRGTRTDTELGGTLFELLIPNALKELVPDKRSLVLLLDGQSARFPWEMMLDPLSADQKPLAIQAGLLRQFETKQFREHPVRAIEPNALVVGDPRSQMPDFPLLPGAKAEAAEVARLLGGNNYSVNSVIEEDAGAVLRALFAKPYRILHLAGHGVFEYHPNKANGDRECPVCKERHDCNEKVTGMVLGPNVFLTPAVIQQMRRVPEFVFINCCHLGNTSGEGKKDRHRLAANLATELIRMGVRAIIAAGWEVHDRAALTFARQLYQALLNGSSFGNAVFLARKAAYDEYAGVNTWGAYQAYGDPDFILVTDSAHSVKRPEASYVAPQEAVVDLRNVVSRAKTEQYQQNKDALAKEIVRIFDAVDKAWLEQAELRAALGEAWFEVGDREQAIQHYTAALSAPKADVSMRAVEQLANAEVRLGAKLITSVASQLDGGGKETFAKGVELNVSGKKRLKPLLEIGKTGERLSLYASACKWAVLAEAPGGARQQALKEMQSAYDEAAAFKMERGELDAYYPLMGWMDATILLAEASSSRSQFERYMLEARSSVRREASVDPNFWNRVADVDLDLRQQLTDGGLTRHVQRIGATYRDVLKRHGSPREKDSVLSTVLYFQEIFHGRGDVNSEHAVQELVQIVRGK